MALRITSSCYHPLVASLFCLKGFSRQQNKSLPQICVALTLMKSPVRLSRNSLRFGKRLSMGMLLVARVSGQCSDFNEKVQPHSDCKRKMSIYHFHFGSGCDHSIVTAS